MTTPVDIIKLHRETLVGRLLGRGQNQLLGFRPRDRGYRMDVCDLFAEDMLSSDNGKKAGNFFRELIGGWTEQKWADIDLPEKLSGRLVRMQKDADNRRRASGMHALFWGWPLAYIPRGGDEKPLATPLLFWRIETKVSRGRLRIRMLEGAPHHNFILSAWLRHKRNLSLDFSLLGGGEASDWDEKCMAEQIRQFTAQWQECQNAMDENDLHSLRKFSAHGKQPAILPCAAIGVAHFKYWALLNDLDELIQKPSESGNLLHEFFGATEAIQYPNKAAPPNESEKYLVEQSDTAQERAVWQARQSKVMLLKGPPGTGKSQTIVNLIADAMQQGKRVALVCHKQAALDVVEKRLAAKGIGHLTVKITDPLAQRHAVIRSLRKIKDGGDAPLPEDNSDERENLSAHISKLEESCDRIAESHGRGRDHSMRGDFLGRMAKVREEAGFNPRSPRHKQFTQDVRSHLSHTENALRGDKEKLRHFKGDYETCRFADNLWSNCHCRPEEDADIAGDFGALVEDAEILDDKRNRLPKEALSSLLFGGLMRHYAPSLFGEEKKEATRLLAELIFYTKRIFTQAQLTPAPPIWREIFQGRGGKIYRRYAEDASHLATVASINARLQDNKLIAALHHHYGEKMAHWSVILDALFCHFELRKLPRHSSANPSRDHESLKDHIDRKRGADAASVLRTFTHRQSAAQEIYDKGLLRLRKSRNGPASTIRGICHGDLEKFFQVFPAMLLDPDSMSQILPLKPGVLDLAIVDEASQMFVADALPILYRAKNIVISGDNMQMSPDDIFFAQNISDDDKEEEYEETEDDSIPTPSAHTEESALLDAAAGWIPADSEARCALNVHYRSRPPELIAFSNHAFYGGNLQASPDNSTPPPPLTRPIELISAAGKFQDRVNKIEAQTIIGLLKSAWSADKPLSVGVIVFNKKQAELLCNMIDAECERSLDFANDYQRAVNRTDDGEDAGFFVRSVENVQGDERDIIILGTTYNNAGNYGLLSRSEKGRRRLNVAVTRAKYGMYVVSSLKIKSISNEGERPGGDNKGNERWYLWKFMQYAAAVSDGDRGAAVDVLRSLNQRYAPHETGREPDSQFEIDVAEFLRAGGYEVNYQIGESGFRIDLGVKRKGDLRYLCGIECDGRFWHDGWKARQNDIWRQGILEDKGWNIYRIWSDAWYSASDTAKKDLLAHLEKLADDAD